MMTKIILAGIVLSIIFIGSIGIAHGKEIFLDSFESLDTSGWLFVGSESIQLINSKDPNHGQVMQLQPNGEVYALIKGSENGEPSG